MLEEIAKTIVKLLFNLGGADCMDMNQYLEVFIEESKEHLQMCSEQLLELEKNPEDLSIVNEIFRAAHTLKGMSATMGYEDLANLTHKMENVLDAIRNEKITLLLKSLICYFLRWMI